MTNPKDGGAMMRAWNIYIEARVKDSHTVEAKDFPEAIEKAKAQTIKMLGAKPDELVVEEAVEVESFENPSPLKPTYGKGKP